MGKRQTENPNRIVVTCASETEEQDCIILSAQEIERGDRRTKHLISFTTSSFYSTISENRIIS